MGEPQWRSRRRSKRAAHFTLEETTEGELRSDEVGQRDRKGRNQPFGPSTPSKFLEGIRHKTEGKERRVPTKKKNGGDKDLKGCKKRRGRGFSRGRRVILSIRAPKKKKVCQGSVNVELGASTRHHWEEVGKRDQTHPARKRDSMTKKKKLRENGR